MYKYLVPLCLLWPTLAFGQFYAYGQPTDGFHIELAQGLMAGEASDHSVILQSRLTRPRHHGDEGWAGILGAPGVARFELAKSSDFHDSRFTAWIDAVREHDHIVKTLVDGLDSGARYYYRLIYGPNREHTAASAAATFRTHADRGVAEAVRLAVISCMNYSFFHYTGGPENPPYTGPDRLLGYPGLASIRALHPDYFISTGDNVYYDSPAIGRAETVHQMRRKHHEQFSQPRFLDLFREAATYWLKDDHDYRFNDADPYNGYSGSGSGHGPLPTHEQGIAVFHEQLPVVDPAAKDPKTYRTFRVNDLVQIWFVEGRDYRSPNDMPDGPKKTIWGEEQRCWLKETLLASDATFKLLVSATPMVGPDRASKTDNHVNRRGGRTEGDLFFEWLADNGFLEKNFYVLAGDRHWKYHGILPSGFEEFSSGTLVGANAIGGTHPGDPDSSDPQSEIKQPFHDEVARGGFLLIDILPEADGVPARALFQMHDAQGAMLYEAVKLAR